MPLTTSSRSYDAVAKTLHWLISFAIIAMLIIGWVMTNMPNNADKFALFQWHKSIGVTILLLSIFRLTWRLIHKAPPLPDAMPQWEKFVAQATHWAFYILIIGMPLTGWATISSSAHSDIPTILYGYITWPNMPMPLLPESKKDIHRAVSNIHNYGAYILAGLLVLHVAAAWKHHLINRDDVLTRMAPGFLTRFLNRLRGKVDEVV